MNASATKIALGTAQFGMSYGIANRSGQISITEIERIISLAQSSGIDLIDTAIAYGSSEECLGTVGVDGWKIVTKIPAMPTSVENAHEWISGELASSFSRLRIKQAYAVLFHHPQDLFMANGKQLIDELQEWKARGYIGKLGVSIYDMDMLPLIYSKFCPDVIQVPFNVMDRRLQLSGWLKELKKRGAEVHVRSAFLQGLLLMKSTDLPNKFMAWKPLWSQWESWLSSNGHSAVSACLRFLLSFKEIDRIVVGIDGLLQLKELLSISRSGGLMVPEYLQSSDLRLINPSSWNEL